MAHRALKVACNAHPEPCTLSQCCADPMAHTHQNVYLGEILAGHREDAVVDDPVDIAY